MASRVHRMRRRRAKYTNGTGSSGSSEENRLGLSRSSGGESSTSADPSSSEQSCDTVIYVGPVDDATDGEHPPVYLPSLNSGDNRCAMSKALRGSIVDRQPSKSPLHQTKKDSGSSSSPSRSPQIARKTHKTEVSQKPIEEQWVDGPRFHKSRISHARVQLNRHQRETWVDGPGGPLPQAAVAPTSSGYGYMDNHKQGMIRQWVETQSAQVTLGVDGKRTQQTPRQQVWIDAQPRPVEPGTPVKVLTVFKTCDDEEEELPSRQPRRKADPDAGDAKVAPAGLTLDQLYTQCEQLAESLENDVAAGECSSDDASDDLSAALDVTSEQVSVGCDSWRRVRRSQAISEESEPAVQVLQRTGDYSPEYIEVEEPDEPVPTQDSCLQVTEEDIAMSMMHETLGGKIDAGDDHPLRALSHDNLTVISHFTGETYSQGTASEWEPIGTSVLDAVTLATSSIENPNFYQAQLEHLAKLHQQLYQQSVAGALQPPSLSSLTTGCNIGSFKELPLLSQEWVTPVQTSTSKVTKTQEARKTLVSTIGMELERELGKEATPDLASLRHPDGASDPHLDKHSSEEGAREDQRLPGNGVPTRPHEDLKDAAATEKPAAPDDAKPHKTPKLSRFFSKSKAPKRNTATSVSSSPVLGPKTSPKPEKRSKSHERASSKHSSPAKAPSRLEVAPPLSMPSSPKSVTSKSSKKDKLKASKSPKKESKWGEKCAKRDVKSYGFSYESCPQTAPSSLCPSEGYESGGSDSGVHLSAASPIKTQRQHRQLLRPIGEMSRKNFSCSTSGSGGSGGSTAHYESSGYESVVRDSECSSLGSSHDSDREPTPVTVALNSCKPVVVGQSSSCAIL